MGTGAWSMVDGSWIMVDGSWLMGAASELSVARSPLKPQPSTINHAPVPIRVHPCSSVVSNCRRSPRGKALLHLTVELIAGEEDTAAALFADQTHIGARAHHPPEVAAAGMGLAHAGAVTDLPGKDRTHG